MDNIYSLNCLCFVFFLPENGMNNIQFVKSLWKGTIDCILDHYPVLVSRCIFPRDVWNRESTGLACFLE